MAKNAPTHERCNWTKKVPAVCLVLNTRNAVRLLGLSSLLQRRSIQPLSHGARNPRPGALHLRGTSCRSAVCASARIQKLSQVEEETNAWANVRRKGAVRGGGEIFCHDLCRTMLIQQADESDSLLFYFTATHAGRGMILAIWVVMKTMRKKKNAVPRHFDPRPDDDCYRYSRVGSPIVLLNFNPEDAATAKGHHQRPSPPLPIHRCLLPGHNIGNARAGVAGFASNRQQGSNEGFLNVCEAELVRYLGHGRT